MSLELTKLADLIENIALLGMSESEYEDERADIRDSGGSRKMVCHPRGPP